MDRVRVTDALGGGLVTDTAVGILDNVGTDLSYKAIDDIRVLRGRESNIY